MSQKKNIGNVADRIVQLAFSLNRGQSSGVSQGHSYSQGYSHSQASMRGREELLTLINSLSEQDLKRFLNEKCETGDPAEFIKVVLEFSPADDEGVTRRTHFFNHCITLLDKGLVKGKKADEIISILIPEVNISDPLYD